MTYAMSVCHGGNVRERESPVKASSTSPFLPPGPYWRESAAPKLLE